MIFDNLMLAFIADYPSTKITISYDPFRDSCRWTAIAYVWRRDGGTQTEAISRLRETLAANTIKTLPPLPADTAWVRAPPSLTWSPIPRRNLSALHALNWPIPEEAPPPFSIVFDWSTGQERLYVPEGS